MLPDLLLSTGRRLVYMDDHSRSLRGRRGCLNSWRWWPKREVITITKHDHPVAMLTPVTPSPNVSEVLAAMAELRHALGSDPIDLRDWINEGRRG